MVGGGGCRGPGVGLSFVLKIDMKFFCFRLPYFCRFCPVLEYMIFSFLCHTPLCMLLFFIFLFFTFTFGH